MAKPYNNDEEISRVSSTNTHQSSCDGCQAAHIYSDRYKCLQCENYDLCGHCFEQRRQTMSHSSGHPMVHFKIPNELFGRYTIRSRNVTLSKLTELLSGQSHNNNCAGCSVQIIGIRFKCDTCHNYNLCLQCMQRQIVTKTHASNHPLVATSNQSLLKIDTHDIVKDRVLGHGAFGQVYKATWQSKHRQVACKIIKVTTRRSHLEASFRKELDAYAELSGVYILKTFGYGERLLADGSKECYLITEFMQRGSLSNVIYDTTEKISLRRKLNMACHIASGMRKLHAHAMIHRDIRLDNILVSSNYTAKIGDMGIAQVFNSDERHTLIGCLPFMPPEFHRGDGQYDQSLDVFTYGLTLNELFTEKPHRFIQSTRRIQLTAESPVFLDLIVRCIDDEPSRRPTAAELEEVLHKYRRHIDQQISESRENYKNQAITNKDSTFTYLYNEYHKKEQEAPKKLYPSPPKPQMISDLIHNLFDDAKKQINALLSRLKTRLPKQLRNDSKSVKVLRYLDDDEIDNPKQIIETEPKIVRKPSPKCPSPQSDFLHARDETPEIFIRAVEYRRSRTPNPFSPDGDHREDQQRILHRMDRFRPINAHDDINPRVRKVHPDVRFYHNN